MEWHEVHLHVVDIIFFKAKPNLTISE